MKPCARKFPRSFSLYVLHHNQWEIERTCTSTTLHSLSSFNLPHLNMLINIIRPRPPSVVKELHKPRSVWELARAFSHVVNQYITHIKTMSYEHSRQYPQVENHPCEGAFLLCECAEQYPWAEQRSHEYGAVTSASMTVPTCSQCSTLTCSWSGILRLWGQ